MTLIHYIVKNTQLPGKGVQNTVELLQQDSTIPFISCYRKKHTGTLDEVQIGEFVKYKTQDLPQKILWVSKLLFW